ncbi:Cytochrome c oxidase copper chaperone-like protein [Hapsidospora chrysogenum ATCC 11550]|uniref:Cytochrome c oxidase copper chaperone-like protein n=1 Tax=Hapsidospora chrysogenum (strain ATCC 11550 / CBS 779.69 / DSM 880 / IAM 14645 / JCM 23072 / IMI 49137) TaxID=857340 RepID=A0A086TD07_HAPC1|nr:Cytochrome c oxidase copper chaperone-like protein [Hapsidospora chrysogenum ATCC 11550]
MGSSQSVANNMTPAAAPPQAPAAAAPAPTSDNASKPKPCCVCKEEKAKRDECMLFSKAADPADDCKSLVDQYKSCMAGYGYSI